MAAILAVCVGMGYLYATPYLALEEYKSALDRRAFRELGAAIDAASVKKSLKDSFANARIRVQKDDAEVGIKSRETLEGLELLFGLGIDQGLDKLLTPEALGQLEVASATKKDFIAEFVPEKHRGEVAGLVAELEAQTDISTGYAGIDAFEVRASHAKLGKATLIFARQGLAGWRLSGIDLGQALPTLMRRIELATSEVALVDAALRKKDIAKARAWAERASEQQLPGGSLRLAMVMIGAPSGRGDAMEGIKRASHEAGMGDASAAMMLARVYESGLEVPEDATEAVKWYKRAIELQASPEVASILSWIYTYGRKGVPQDFREAAEWARRAADLVQDKNRNYRTYLEGRHEALSALARGDGDPKTHKRGRWWRGGGPEIVPGQGVGPVRFGASPAESLDAMGDCDSWASDKGSGWCNYYAWNWNLTMHFDLDASAKPVVIRSSREFPKRLTSISIYNPSGQAEEPLKIGGASVEDALQRFGAEDRTAVNRSPWCPLQKKDVLESLSRPLESRWHGSATAHFWPSIWVVRCDGNGRVVRVGLKEPGSSEPTRVTGRPGVDGAANDFRVVPTFVYAYQDKFKALPGDDGSAASRWGIADSTPSGNRANNVIDGKWNSTIPADESRLFWQHVRLAKLASGPTNSSDPAYLPRNAFGGVIGISSATPAQLQIEGMHGTYQICSSGIPGGVAVQLDAILDEGQTSSGSVRAVPDLARLSTAGTPRHAIEEHARYTVCLTF